MAGRDYTIKAIPTTHNGINYLSKLEAQWAIFFDELNLPFNYEPDGYKLPSGVWYKPDFWLPDQGLFLEIKPTKPTDEEESKAADLAVCTRYPVYIFYGLPLDYVESMSNRSGIWFSPEGYSDPDHQFCECPSCGLIEISYAGLINNLSCKCSDEGDLGNESDNLVRASQAARRFNPRKNRA